MSSFKQYDLLLKERAEIQETTAVGGAISLLLIAIALLGTAAELNDYAATKTVDKLIVDSSHERGAKTLTLNIDLTLTDLACHEIVTKVTDGQGHALLATDANTLHKLRVDAAGAPLDAPRRAQWNSCAAPIFTRPSLLLTETSMPCSKTHSS